jgi:hypothetical protein
MQSYIGHFTETSRLAEFDKALDDSLKRTPIAPGNVANLASHQLKAMDNKIATDAFAGFKDVLADHDHYQSSKIFIDHGHQPQAVDGYGSPWLIAARVHKVLSGCRSVPLSGLGHVLKVMSGEFFISCVSLQACETHDCQAANLLSSIDGRQYATLIKKQWVQDCVLKGAVDGEKNTFLFVPPGWWPNICAMSVHGDRYSATLFAQPYLNANLLAKTFGLGVANKQHYEAAWEDTASVVRIKPYAILAGVETFLRSIVAFGHVGSADVAVGDAAAEKLVKVPGEDDTTEE